MVNFIPDQPNTKALKIPFFEDVSTAKHGVKGQHSTKTLSQIEGEIRSVMGRLGGAVTNFVYGKTQDAPKRFAVQVDFTLGSARGQVIVAALPFKHGITDKKREQAIKQALIAVRDMLHAQYDSVLFIPGTIPLLPYLLLADGQTVTEAVVNRTSNLPMLAGVAQDVIEGEIVK